MSRDGHSAVGVQFGTSSAFAHGHAVDGVHHASHHRSVDAQSRVAQQVVLQFVAGQVSLSDYEVLLCLPVGVAQCHGHPIVRCIEQRADELPVDLFVVVCEYSARRSVECYATSFFAHEHSLAYVFLYAVVWAGVARCSYPYRQVRVREVLEVSERQNILVRDGVCRSVSAVVHDESSALLLRLYHRFAVGVSVARCRLHACEIVPHDFPYVISRKSLCHVVRQVVRRVHVYVVVAVVAHEHQCVLPRPCIPVFRIRHYLVHCNRRLFWRICRYSSDADVRYSSELHSLSALCVQSLVVIEKCDEIFCYVTLRLAHRVLALVAQQQVVCIQASALLGQEAVVPHAFSHQQ